MTRTALLAFVAATALAGCQQNTIDPNKDESGGEANVVANAPVALPPAIVATKLYRCGDNSVVTIDYLADSKTANVRVKDAPAVQVTAPEAGKPMTAAGGYSVEGSATASSAKISVPGHSGQTCKS